MFWVIFVTHAMGKNLVSRHLYRVSVIAKHYDWAMKENKDTHQK